MQLLSPPEIIARLEAAYGPPRKRVRRDPLDELVLTVLSQNTSDVNSDRAFERLRDAFTTWDAVMSGDVRRIEEAIRPGGLAPSKAPRIQAMLREIWARRDALDLRFLAGMPLEDARSWLLSLPGVGPKTAACVLLFSLDMPALPVDTHVWRVARRLGLVPHKSTPEQAHRLLEALVEPDDVYRFHLDLIEHGRRTCVARRPRCAICVLRDRCPSAALFLAADVAT